MTWMAGERRGIAAERILDAAGGLFVERGISGVSMAEVAKAAGCSRATLYRYFADRRDLHLAFIHREARRISALVVHKVASIEDPEAQLIAAVSSALQMVRDAPHLAAWFSAGDTAVTSALVRSSDVLDSLGLWLVPDPVAARWLVRVLVLLLIMPGRDEAEEREMIARFVAPLVVGSPKTGLRQDLGV